MAHTVSYTDKRESDLIINTNYKHYLKTKRVRDIKKIQFVYVISINLCLIFKAWNTPTCLRGNRGGYE